MAYLKNLALYQRNTSLMEVMFLGGRWFIHLPLQPPLHQSFRHRPRRKDKWRTGSLRRGQCPWSPTLSRVSSAVGGGEARGCVRHTDGSWIRDGRNRTAYVRTMGQNQLEDKHPENDGMKTWKQEFWRWRW